MRAPFVVAGISGLLVFSATGWTANPADSSDPDDSVAVQRSVLEDAVRFALEQELDGNNVDRNALLLHVLEQDPGFAPAHWHLGDLKAGDQWVSYRRFVDDEDERWHQLYLYRQNREKRGDTVEDHLAIANGARTREMWDEDSPDAKSLQRAELQGACLEP